MGDKLGDLFSDRPLPASPPPTDRPPPARPGSALRWVLPVALFVGIVATVAWVSQNLPKRGARPVTPVTPPAAESSRPADLKFLRTRAVWDAADPDYLKEYEPGVEGHYDFPFVNPNDRPVTLGFARTSCDCSQLKVAALGPSEASDLAERMKEEPFRDAPNWTWTELPQHETDGVEIPAKGGGVARIHWNGRKSAGQALRLNIRMWMQPPGKSEERSFETLEVPIVMADPVRFLPVKLSLGPVGAGGVVREEVVAFSSTRDRIALKVDEAQLDPLFSVTLEGPLDERGLEALKEKLRAGNDRSRIRSAVRLQVRLSEQAGERQLDQGPFGRDLPVEMEDGTPIQPPQVTATVKGDVEIGIPEDGGKVVFRPFDSRDGSRKLVPLWTEGGELTVERVRPSFLEVKLRPVPKESSPGRTKWMLEVTVPPGALLGAFREDSVILLKAPGNRRVRVPVVGTAGQG